MVRCGRSLLQACTLVGLGCALAAGDKALAQPGNDVCAQAMTGYAIPPGGGTVTGTLVGASRDATSTYCPGNQTGPDVYHTITPTLAGVYTFETCGLATWDTVLSLHTGCPVSAANQVGQACSDDTCGTQSRMSATLVPGQTYIVRVGAYSNTSAVGPYSLLVTYTPPLTNDECGSTNPALTLDVPTTGSTVGATTTLTVTPNTLCGTYGGSGGGADVFFRFVAPSSGTYTFSTCGSNFDTVMSVHSACPVGVENLLGCNDDGPSAFCSGSGFVSFLTLPLTAQQLYYVRAGGYAAQVPATGMVTVTVHRTQSAVVTGACCGVVAGTPTCEVRPADQCVGGYLGDDTSCSPDPCTVTGACCRSDGSCVRVSAVMCPGTYQGDLTACGNSMCPPPPMGVCCIGAICMITLPADCSSPGPLVGAVWVNGASECNVSAAAQVPCCRADFNKVDGITIQDIFDYLNAWFEGSVFTHLATPGTATIQDIFDFLNLWFAGGC